jgi:hypothetical protein
MSIIESTQIAFFQHFGATGKNVSLSEMLDGIKGNAWKGQVKRLRAKGREAVGYDETKKKLPAFMLSGTTNGGHKAAAVIEHSGLLQIDVDEVGADHAADFRDKIGEDRHILAAWISPSGDGVKAVMRIPASVAEHKAAFAAAADYMRETYDVEIDKQCSDVGRLCFVSHDPALVVNLDAVPLEVSAVFDEPACPVDSSTTLHLPLPLPLPLPLHNKAFSDFDGLPALYQRLVVRRFGKAQRGFRNDMAVELVASLFCFVAPQFVLVFAEEYYSQNLDVFSDYDFATYQNEVSSLLEGCLRSYRERLTGQQRAAYDALRGERETAIFRIVHGLAESETEPAFPPPLFFLSYDHLGDRIGVHGTTAQRIMNGFIQAGILLIEVKGTKRAAGERGATTVWRWLL